MKNKHLFEFSKMFSGIFSNKEQALDTPKYFAHIQIHIRPLPFKTFNCYAFYAEQRYQHDIWNPYRQSINKVSQDNDIFIVSNHQVENQERFTGGGINTSLLNQLSKYKLKEKRGCSMHFRKSDLGNYIGNIEPGMKCYVQKGDSKTYVKSEVLLSRDILITEDSGYEKDTDKKIWGSDFGPLIFKKINNFDEFIDQTW